MHVCMYVHVCMYIFTHKVSILVSILLVFFICLPAMDYYRSCSLWVLPLDFVYEPK